MAQKKTIAELLIKIGVSVEGAAKVERRIEGLKDKSQKAAKGFGQLRQRLKKVDKEIKKVGDAAKKSALAITALAVGTTKFAISQLEAIDATNKMAESVGVGVEEFQRLEFAAGQSGVSSERLGMALKGLNARLLAVKQTGTGEAKMALDDLGLSLDQLEGKTATEKFATISEALKGVEDDATRSALSARLFGEEAGPALANLLAQGGDGIRDLAAQAQVLTEEQADAATETVDRLGELKNELGFVAQTIAVDLIPVIKPLIIEFREFIRNNRELIRERVGEAFTKLADGIKFVAENWKLFAAGFAAAKIIPIVAAIVKISGAFGGLGVSLTALAGPAGLIAGAAIAFSELKDYISETNDELDALNEKTGKAQFAVTKSGRAAMAQRAARSSSEQELKDILRNTEGASDPTALAMREAAMAEMRRRDLASVDEAIGAMGTVYDSTIRRRNREKPKRTARGTGAKTKAEPKSNVTFADVLRTVLRGRGENVAENVRGLAARTPATKAITPTVAVDFTYITVNQEISNPDPMAAGSAAAEGVRRVWQKAITTTGQQMPALPSR